jgi:hypothetical protein
MARRSKTDPETREEFGRPMPTINKKPLRVFFVVLLVLGLFASRSRTGRVSPHSL